MSWLRQTLGYMPKRQITAVLIAGLLLLFTAGGVVGANAAAAGMANPDLIGAAEADLANGTMNESAFQADGVPTAPGTDTVLEHESLNRLVTPVVKLGFYPAQAGSAVAHWSVGALGQGATLFWLYGTLAGAPAVVVGHAGRRVIGDE